MHNRPIRVAFQVFFLLFAALVANLAWRMVIAPGSYSNRAFRDERFVATMQRLIDTGVITARGKAVDVDRERLSQEVPSAASRKRIERNLPYIFIEDGRPVFDEDYARITDRHLSAGPSFSRRGRILDRYGEILAETVNDKRTGKVSRRYPGGPAAFGVVGHADRVYGRRFIEADLDAQLSGDATRSPLRWFYDFIQPGETGDDVVLTIDAALQQSAYRLLEGKRGAAVVLDARTGEVLAAASRPTFDPATPPGPAWEAAFRDRETRPIQNRAFTALYPPGSTFKIVDAAAMLESKAVPAGFSLTCTGRNEKLHINDLHVHGEVSLGKALAQSCNVFFSEVGVALGPRLAEYAAKFGFGAEVLLLPQFEGAGLRAVASRAFSWPGPDGRLQAYTAADFSRNQRIVAQGAIGQNLVQATPLQMAMVAQTIANEGLLAPPYLVRAAIPGDARDTKGVDKLGGKLLTRTFDAPNGRRVVSSATAKTVRRYMEDVMRSGTGARLGKIVRDKDGYRTVSPEAARSASGIAARLIPGLPELVPVAGKTGTAEVGDRDHDHLLEADERPHAWFVGFAPADNPRVIVAVVVENGGLGGTVAGPIAIDLLVQALNALELPAIGVKPVKNMVKLSTNSLKVAIKVADKVKR